MLQVQRNLTNGSASKSKNFVKFIRTESSIVDHMELSLYKSTCDNHTLKKTVLIFTGYEYMVTFFDIEAGKSRTLKGRIESFTGDNSANHYFTLRYVPECPKPDTSVTEVVKGMPNCGCVFNKPSDDKYPVSKTVDVYVSMITDINYCAECIPQPCIPKKGVKVVLLGIGAEIVRAVVVNLKLLEDGCGCEDAVRDVNLRTGNVYTIAFYNSKDNAMYEFDGKLVAIKETQNEPSKDSVVRVSENCGLSNSIYNSKCDCGCMDDYLTSDPLKNDVLLTFDTSTDFSGEYQSIMLSWVRDCTPIKESPEECPPVCPDPDLPNCENCCYTTVEITSGNTPVVIDTKEKEVTYSHNGIEGKVTLQEVIDFYFGCQC